jgi:hypothetical protein
VVKFSGSTGELLLILINSRMGEVSGIAGVGVKSVNIGRNTKCEGSLLEHF